MTPAADSDTDVALRAAAAGVAVLRGLYGTPLERVDKSAVDFATEADLASEHAVREVVRRACPDDAFVGEETGESGAAGATRRWLVDPLCGTLNYAAGTPLAVLNVALEVAGEVTVGVSADPVAEETFWGDASGGWLRRGDDDVPLRPTVSSRLVEINCDGPPDIVGPRLVSDPDFRAVFGPRVLSSTIGVAWVAAGRRAAYVTDGDRHGDVHFAAGVAVCRAAGCVVSDLDGGPVTSGRGIVVADSGGTHAAVLGFVRRVSRR